MGTSNTQRAVSDRAYTAGAAMPAAYTNFRRLYDAEPDRKWQVEVLQSLIKYSCMEQGWDGYSAPPISRDVSFFALEILNHVMRPRTPIPQVVPSSMGGIQLEWHQKGVDLEIHIIAPYQCEVWFQDHQHPDTPPFETEMSNDFSIIEKPISLLTAR
jgi:hypothetical protein